MYRNVIIGFLLSGYMSSVVTSEEEATSTIDLLTTELALAAPEIYSTPGSITEQSVTRSQPATGQEQTGARKQFEHPFSELVIIVIIFGVMAAIITVILLLAYGIRKMRQKSSVPIQPEFPQNADEPLSSVETGNPEQ
ncbi:glycophorin-A [Sturnira hondurensis]|uniref:glycophorin-A n=1 Tax=Sturnira hondurensis TaxID=192404 RepID=UPI00187A4BED|nr:glycophorin-A [Sturnira hondurensis]